MRRIIGLLFTAGLFALGASAGLGCDLCGCYTPQLEALPKDGAFDHSGDGAWWNNLYLAVAEQFTHFGTLQLDGEEVDHDHIPLMMFPCICSQLFS